MATVAYWVETQLAGPGGGPCKPEHAQGESSAHTVRDHHVECGQHTQRGVLTDTSPELERRQGFHLAHPHGSSYEPQHLNLEEVAGKRGLTGEAVRAVATDVIKGGNGV
jgi:hypothetical protein